MQIINHSISSFISSALTNLGTDPIQNNLFCGVLLDFQKNFLSMQNTNTVFFEILDSSTTSHFYFFQPRPECALMSQGDESTLDFFVNEILKLNIKIQGIIGPSDTLNILTDQWLKRGLPPLKVLMNQNIMAANLINSPNPEEGKLITANQEHFTFLFENSKLFYQETNPNLTISDDHLKLRIQMALAQQEYFLWEHQNNLMGYIQVGRPVFNTISVLALYIKPEYRFKKIGTNLMAQTCQNLLKAYQSCSLFTDQTVAHTNSLYQKLGFRIQGHFQHLSFSSF